MTLYKRSQITLLLGAALWVMAAALDCNATFCNNDPVNQVDELGLAGYFFDGTWLDMNDPDQKEKSNVAKMHNNYQGLKFYESGVGSGFLTRFLGGMFGLGGDNRLQSMYDNVVRTYNEPGDPENQQIDIIGFSRGAALARAFANMIYQKGIKLKNGTTRRGRDIEIRFLGVFDTVASFGWPGNNINSGYALTLAPNVKKAAHATARDEVRSKFPLTSFKKDPRVESREFAGVHADIGGVYLDKPIQGYTTLHWMWLKAWSAGVPMGGFPSDIQAALRNQPLMNHVYQPAAHDSTKSIMYTGDRVRNNIKFMQGETYGRKVYEH